MHGRRTCVAVLTVGIGVVATFDGIPYWCLLGSTVPIVPMF